MKKSILIASLLCAASFAVPAHAESAPLTLLINGNEANNAFNLSLSPDGRDYVITSTLMLEVGGDVCSHPDGVPNVLECTAPAIAGFEIKSLEGADRVT